MASLADIRAGLAANLAALDGIKVSAYVLANQTPPVVWVKPSSDQLITYHEAMQNGLEFWHFVVEAYTGTISDLGAQMKLDELIRPATASTSIKDAIEADLTLGGIAEKLVCEEAHGYQEYARQDGTTVLGCRFNVTVYMTGG